MKGPRACVPGSTQSQTELIIELRSNWVTTVPLDECELIEQVNAFRVYRYGSVIGATAISLHGRASFDGDDFVGYARLNVASFQVPIGKDRDSGQTGFIIPVEGGFAVEWKGGGQPSGVVGFSPTVCGLMSANHGQEWLDPSIYMDAFGRTMPSASALQSS